MDLLFLDTETTGNMPGKDRLVSIAYKAGADMTHEFFKPAAPISVDAMATHHITNEMVADKPTFIDSDLYKALSELLPVSIVVAHNAAFDIGILETEGLKVPNYICTYKVARAIDSQGTIPRYSLQYLRYYLKLNVNGVTAHDAAGDVQVLEALFDRLKAKMEVEKMQEVSKQPVLLRHLQFGKYKGQLIRDIAQNDPGYLEWLLREKQKDQSASPWGRDDDLIYTLKQHLAHH
jgi:exodeoxyribonuclease X